MRKGHGQEVSSMKVSVGAAAKGRGAVASRHAAPPRRAAAPAPAKAVQATASAKSAKPEPAPKAATKAAVKPPVPKPPVAKAAPEKRTPTGSAASPVAKPPAAASEVVSETTQTKPRAVPSPEVAVPAPAQAPPPADRRPAIPDRLPARPLGKAEIFVEGDHVVYPTHGVGKVERIATEEIAGHKLELIHITFEENRMTLRVPVAKARSAGLRKLATRKLFDEALAVLKGRARIKRTMWSRRAQEYEAKINSGDPLAIAEVVRDLHRNAGQPDQSFSERQIYEAAMDRLAAELGALDKTDKLTAATKLTNFLKTV